MPELSFSEVEEILRLLQAMEGDDITLQYGDLTVSVNRVSVPGEATREVSAGEHLSSGPGTTVNAAVLDARQPSGISAPDSSSATRDPVGSPPVDDLPEGWVAVSAPMAGTFYRGPSPAEPPFVEVGDRVSAGDQVGLIEVMKLYAELTSDVDGVVTRIDVPDASLVEFETPVIWIDAS